MNYMKFWAFDKKTELKKNIFDNALMLEDISVAEQLFDA